MTGRAQAAAPDPSRRAAIVAGLLAGLAGTPAFATAAGASRPARTGVDGQSGQEGAIGQPPRIEPPSIRPRQDWAAGRAATGPLEREDVKFLLVHHTLSPNGYGQDEVPALLRGFLGYHTGPEKGWPDIAYNFLVDAHGTIWEGRTGSLAGPVRGDATGGSQGFAQLCCFIGDHTGQPPTRPAQAAMSNLLAWLAVRYGIDLHAGPTITFASRGSNKWPAGVQVSTDPVAAHRDMSSTQCPGDACYPLVRGSLLATARQLAAAASAPTSTPPAPTGRDPAAESSREATRGTAAARPATQPADAPDDGAVSPVTIGAAAGGAAAALGIGAYAVHAVRRRDQPPQAGDSAGDPRFGAGRK